MRKEIETCCVADQFCEAPANLDPPKQARCECSECGRAVCGKCSSIRTTAGERRRLCHDCQVDLDGDDTMVMKRLHKLAGVPYVPQA
jgi:hypothetical protein